MVKMKKINAKESTLKIKDALEVQRQKDREAFEYV